MKYALVNNIRKEAEPKEVGKCICCGTDVRAYCGLERVHHWKHKKAEECDSWHEGETQWHRDWKNHFDISQQEVVMHDSESGEKHIADVYIESRDLVIEFQHSPIHIDEIKAREAFYKRMIWVVDLYKSKDNIVLHNKKRRGYDSVFEEHIYTPWLENEIITVKKLYNGARIKEAERRSRDRTMHYHLRGLDKKYFGSKNKEGYCLMLWKHQHRRWNEAGAPIFFDIGDDNVYYLIMNLRMYRAFIVKRFSKQEFLNHYQ